MCAAVCLFIQAPLLSGSRVSLITTGIAVCSFVRSLISAFPILYLLQGLLSVCFIPASNTPTFFSDFSTPLSKRSPTLLLCDHTHYSVDFTIQGLSSDSLPLCLSQTQPDAHTPTVDLVVRLLLTLLSTICGCFTLTDGCHGGVA